MNVGSFDDIAEEFDRRIRRVVWCSVSTVDTRDRTRVRILHPIWTGPTGWIATHRDSVKGKHIAHNPHVSVSYLERLEPWGTEQVYADCVAAWEDAPAERRRIWELYKTTPPPLGYDPGLSWKGVDDPKYGLLKLTPWRIELSSLKPSAGGWKRQVWTPAR